MKHKKQKPSVNPVKECSPTAFELGDGHHCFSGSGFEVRGDRVYLSPGLVEAANHLSDREDGLRKLLDMTNMFVGHNLAVLEKERRSWWDMVIRDLNLQNTDTSRLTVDVDGYVFMEPEPKPKGEGEDKKDA